MFTQLRTALEADTICYSLLHNLMTISYTAVLGPASSSAMLHTTSGWLSEWNVDLSNCQ